MSPGPSLWFLWTVVSALIGANHWNMILVNYMYQPEHVSNLFRVLFPVYF